MTELCLAGHHVQLPRTPSARGVLPNSFIAVEEIREQPKGQVAAEVEKQLIGD